MLTDFMSISLKNWKGKYEITEKRRTEMAKNLVSFRKAERTLIDNGFKLDRISSSHYHYVKDGIKVILPIRLNKMIWQRIKKENNLIA